MSRGGIRARWAVPAGALAAVGIVIAASAVASAQAVPSLPSRSAAQLLAGLAQAGSKPLGPLTATVQQTSSLGLPQLPAALQQNGAAASPLAGSESVSIWYRDPQHLRLALPVQAGETDYRLSGRTLWIWDSKTQTATHVALPAHFAFRGNGLSAPLARTPAASVPGTSSVVPDSPMAAANQVLKAVGPTTAVSVQRNLYVAGQAAYQLALVPRSGQSLVGRVLIAIDASRHFPLRVQVFARGASSPAYSIGFTALSFTAPAASNFSFTPPAGATVKKETAPDSLKGLLPGGLHSGLSGPGGTSASRHSALSTLPARKLANGTGAAKVIGTSWLSVVASPPSPQIAAAVGQLLSRHPGPAVQSVPLQSSGSGSAAYSSSLVVGYGPGPDMAVLRDLLQATKAVHGTWGSGRLLQTKLFSVLVTSDGRILAGAVSPAVLYRDVALDAG
jgi:hypothetical protein